MCIRDRADAAASDAQAEVHAVREFFQRYYEVAPQEVFLEPHAEGSWRVYCPALLGLSLKSAIWQQAYLEDLQYEVDLSGFFPHSVGGDIRQLAWDDRGERLAVTFTGSQPNSELIALFSTSISPDFELNPLGYLRGPPDGGKAHHIMFRPQHPRGSLLTVSWLNGQISLFPLLYR